jgi:pantoate--beta-alanine ligase
MPTTASEIETAVEVADVRRRVAAARTAGRRVAFVPTMGFLHEGHLQLVARARAAADFVVMSIFVNPLQFGPGEDFTRYPRDAEGDAVKARNAGVDLLFTPTVETMYPGGAITAVVPTGLETRWEGAVRPGHFRGVCTVVAKLFNIVQPDFAVFGQKDVQQATIVRAMVRDLDLPLEVVVAPTVREADGLAMSSRNSYLSAEERVRARALSASLRAARAAFAAGARDVGAIEAAGRAVLDREGRTTPDYFAVVDPQTLEPATIASPTSLVLVAARVGATRLIDNDTLGG